MLRVVKWAGIAIGALIVALVIFLGLFDWNTLKGSVESNLSQQLQRPVHIGRLHVTLLSLHPRAQVDTLQIGNPQWAGGGLMASARRITVQAALLPLLHAQLILTRVVVSNPDLFLFRSADGRANWQFGSSAGRPTGPPSERNQPTRLPLVRQLYIDSGRMRVIDRERKLFFSGTFGAQQGGGGSQGTQPFRLSGDGSLNRRPFLLTVSGGPLIWAESHKPYPFDVRVTASDIHASARGIVPTPFDLGHLSVTLGLSGDDLADLYYLTGLTLPNSPPYSLSGHLERKDTRFDFTNVVGRLGRSEIHGSVSAVVVNDRPSVEANLVSNALYLEDLAPTFGAPSTPAEKRKAAREPWLLPRAPLELDRIRGMDATLSFRADRIVAQKLPIEKVSARVKLDHGLLSVAPFAFALPLGAVAGDLRLDARRQVPLTDVDIRLLHVHLSNFKPAGSAQPPLEGILVGRIQLAGSGDSVHTFASTADGTVSIVIPNGAVDQAFAELAGIDVARGLGLLLTAKDKQAPVRCGIADFRARRGVLRAQQVVFDTKTVLITGKGRIDLRRERLNLDIDGNPKKFRLVRLKTPVAITGTLRKPSIRLKAGNAPAQAAIAAVLGTIATPFAAIAAFVDPGLTKNADCQGLLAEAKGLGAPVKTAASKSERRGERR